MKTFFPWGFDRALSLSPTEVAVFASWDVFPFMTTYREGNVFCNAGYENVPDELASPSMRALHDLQRNMLTPWDNVRHDSITAGLAQEYLKRHRPRLLYVALGETDDWGHERRYDRVIATAALFDEELRKLWNWVQGDDRYRDATTFVITTDHGRGKSPRDWTDHGSKVDGAENIWIAIVGPDTPKLGEIGPTPTVYLSNVAATILSYLELDSESYDRDIFPSLDNVVPAFRGNGSDQQVTMRHAKIDGTAAGWRALGKENFVNVNCNTDTWRWTASGIHCSGTPIGVIRTKKIFTNFELVVEWRHRKSAGNSGVFVWASPESIKKLESGKGRLPAGIEVQILDHGYGENYEKEHGKKSTWFTTHGDVFPTGPARMTPFPPVSENGKRSFPSKNLTKGIGEWNHYYVRCLNGELRLWVNGEEVSGGTECEPHSGYLCLESEGSPIDFRGLRIRELP